MAYSTTDDVQANLPGRTLSASSKPALAQVSGWITQGDALLDGSLAAKGMTVPYTEGANALAILKSWSLLYAEGHTRMAFASGGGDGGNEDGKDLLEQFEKVLAFIRENPGDVAAMLGDGSAPEATKRFRGYVLDNDDSVSIGNGDFAPVFTKAALDGQF